MNAAGINTDILDSVIVGRVEPHIYAFTTETVPNYLKVGDTYRPISVRIDEWRDVFPNLRHVYDHSARIDDDTIFRDYAVHKYLETYKHRHRLLPDDIPHLAHYSREFFKGATPADVDEAIGDIHRSARENDGRYALYSSDHLPKTFTYTRGECLVPRENQQHVIDNFKAAVNNGRNNLLMFAVMRFGKSFTSMCCAMEMDADLVLVVSAKADVKEEWKKTVESIGNFNGYIFADKTDLQGDLHFIRNLKEDNKKVVLFLTLQDLQGNNIKKAHREAFATNWDLLIVDETHFGARAEHYGKVLLNKKEASAEIKRQMDGIETLENLEETIKELRTRITIHLSGTPYRILMGSEFEKEDIIAFVQFSDIAEAQEKWNEEHMYDEDTPEWDNPYFGFPQMIRFAFSPNQTSLERIAKLKASGATSSFSELFKPQSLSASKEGFNRFVHKDVVLDFLKVIDGVKDDTNVLGFLDNARILEGKLCRHMVFVLPYCASCDAMEALIKENGHVFRHLSQYEILNISGVKRSKRLNDTSFVKQFIAECEAKGKKTLTLTVNRMLTGNTVPQWDTMLFLKQSSSPEEYDQAIFRLQNPFVDVYEDNGKVIKFNMKPQTILVDFDPERVFRLQERKSQIYNVNTDNNGNSRLRERIEKELKISPIIILDHNKLREASATNILDAVRNYAETRSVLDEASEMPIDLSLLDNPALRHVISSLNEIDSKKGILTSVNEQSNDDGDDVNPTSSQDTDDNSSANDNKTSDESNASNDDENSLAKKFASYYALILFFAFLTDDKVRSLEDIIGVMNSDENNVRMSKNLGLSSDILKFIQTHCNGFALSKLDYKIENINSLNRDNDKTPLERVKLALTKFGRMSSSEIVTPHPIAEEMVNMLPDDIFSKGNVLDIASKQAEFTIALISRYGSEIGHKIFSICTSSLAYEFTRKAYSLLGINHENIFKSITSFDLIKPNNDDTLNRLKSMNIASIVGNPPYMEVNKGNGNGADPIFHLFIDLSMNVSPNGTLIHPARFLFNAGKTPKSWNHSIINNRNFKVSKFWLDSSSVFPIVEIPGGIASTYWDKDIDFGVIGSYSPYPQLTSIIDKVWHKATAAMSDIVYPREYYKLTEALYHENPNVATRQSAGHKYSLGANIFDIFPELFINAPESNDTNEYCKIIGRINGERGYKLVRKSYITQRDNFQNYKIIIPKADGAAGQIGKPIPARILGKPDIGNPNEAYTDSFISIGNFISKEVATACYKYVLTKFARALLGVLKVTQMNTRDTWSKVPLQDFSASSDIDWSKTVDEIDKQLYAKYGLSKDEISFIESLIKPM